MKMLLALPVIALTSCTNTMKVLDGADYICINGELSGIYTGSGAVGRGLKIPEGVVLTPELLEALCTR
jgi:hypothetical protein